MSVEMWNGVKFGAGGFPRLPDALQCERDDNVCRRRGNLLLTGDKCLQLDHFENEIIRLSFRSGPLSLVGILSDFLQMMEQKRPTPTTAVPSWMESSDESELSIKKQFVLLLFRLSFANFSAQNAEKRLQRTRFASFWSHLKRAAGLGPNDDDNNTK